MVKLLFNDEITIKSKKQSKRKIKEESRKKIELLNNPYNVPYLRVDCKKEFEFYGLPKEIILHIASYLSNFKEVFYGRTQTQAYIDFSSILLVKYESQISFFPDYYNNRIEFNFYIEEESKFTVFKQLLDDVLFLFNFQWFQYGHNLYFDVLFCEKLSINKNFQKAKNYLKLILKGSGLVCRLRIYKYAPNMYTNQIYILVHDLHVL